MAQKYFSVLGNEWFQAFSQFRLNPDNFFDKKKLTGEGFCLDILREVYLDSINVQCRISLLLLLQEHSLSLIKDLNMLEQVVGSLLNLLDTLKSSVANKLLKSQILSTACTLLLTSDYEPDHIIRSFQNLLLSIIYDDSDDPLLTAAACQCLEEIEVHFPNILVDEFLTIQSSCEKHVSPAFQNYALLLSLCMKNVSLKAANREKMNGERDKLSHLPSVVSYLLELIPLMSSASSFRLMKNLMPVVENSSISPMVFKLYLPNLMFSSAIPYNHLAFDLLASFQRQILASQDERVLLQRWILLSSHPCLAVSHRLLFLDWFKFYMKREKLSQTPTLQPLLPGPFDGPITQEKKCHVCASNIPCNTDNIVLDFLDECISGLKKCAVLPGGTKAGASLFRTLYIYYSLHQVEFMFLYLYKLVLQVLKTSPHLLQYAISFLSSIKVEFPETVLPRKALSHMVDHILNLPLKQFYCNTKCYLAILEKATEVCTYESKPQSILRLLQTLLTDLCSTERNTWELGNNILSVCLSILKFHDAQLFYSDLAEVLCLISQSIQDVDIRDRAKLYYCTLTTLSKLKVQSIFVNESHKTEGENQLTSYVPGVSPRLQSATSVQLLPKPPFKLSRSEKCLDVPLEDYFDPQNVADYDILAMYKQFLQSSDFSITVPFVVKHVDATEESFETLYGILISSTSSPASKKISSIQVPVLSKSVNKGTVVSLQIIPYASQPMDIHFKAEFNCSNGISYISHPDSVSLELKDYFLCLPTLDCTWKKQLFERLWDELDTHARFNKKGYFKSVFCVKTKKEEISTVLDKEWKKFVVSRINEYSSWIAIFLPPHSHLLMKSDLTNDKPFITFLGDDISLLSWIGLYFQNIKTEN